MTKNEFWDQKHTEIGEKFGVSSKTIGLLRTLVFNGKMTRGQIILWMKDKIEKTVEKKKCEHCNGTGYIEGVANPKKEYVEAVDLIKRLKDGEWKDIVFEYVYTE